jgi:hypothetical protein
MACSRMPPMLVGVTPLTGAGFLSLELILANMPVGWVQNRKYRCARGSSDIGSQRSALPSAVTV